MSTEKPERTWAISDEEFRARVAAFNAEEKARRPSDTQSRPWANMPPGWETMSLDALWYALNWQRPYLQPSDIAAIITRAIIKK